MTHMVDADEANDVYDILVACCDAPESNRELFVANQIRDFIREWRFIGALGFGGKVRRTDARGRWWVTMYPEDETPERLQAAMLANAALTELEQMSQ